MALFDIKNLSFSYPDRERVALDGVSLSVARGDFVVVCGKSGCGKSTLLRHLKTVLTPFGKHEGEVLFDGRPLDSVSQREQASRIGFVLQSPENQIVTDKVWHELAFGLESLGEKTPVIRRRVAEMASFFGIQEWYEKSVFELSGGQKQLLALAAVLTMRPDALILDEPTAQLDPIAAEDFVETLKKINDETGATIIMSEHRLEGALPRADHVIVMSGGKVVCEGTSSEAALALKEKEDPMLSAMPAPMRVFLALEPQGEPKGDGSSGSLSGAPAVKEPKGDGSSGSHSGAPAVYVPQTVREGRLYLEWKYAVTQDTSTFSMQQQYGSFAARVDTAARVDPVTIGDVAACGNAVHLAAHVDASPVQSPASPKITQQRINEAFRDEENPLLKLKDVWFRYEREGRDVIKDLALTVYTGEFVCVVGGNGTGKSTMLGVVSGQNRRYRGYARTLGLDPGKAGGRALSDAGLAALPQDPQTLFTRATVFDNLIDVASACAKRRGTGSKPEEIESEVRRVCELTDTVSLLGFHPYDVSGGEQQRAGLAMALLAKPKLLLLDEPTKGMEGFFKEEFSAILKNLCGYGMGVLMASHDVEFCAKYADRCALFFDGGIVSEGEPRAFFSGNSFYTTAANRMARGLFPDVITAEEIIEKTSARAK